MLPLLSYADIYVWDDQQGSTHFSDTIEPGAKALPLTDAQSYSAPTAPVVEKTVVAAKPRVIYKELRITHPTDQQTVVKNKQGNVTVNIVVHPALQVKHDLRLIMDGKIMAAHKKIIFELKNIERGQHVLQVQIINAQGGVLRESTAVTFYVQRSKVKHHL